MTIRFVFRPINDVNFMGQFCRNQKRTWKGVRTQYHFEYHLDRPSSGIGGASKFNVIGTAVLERYEPDRFNLMSLSEREGVQDNRSGHDYLQLACVVETNIGLLGNELTVKTLMAVRAGSTVHKRDGVCDDRHIRPLL